MIINYKKLLIHLFLFVIIISPSIIIAYYSYTRLHDQLTQYIFSRRESIAKLLAAQVESRLDGVKDIGKAGAAHVSPLVKDGKWDTAMSELDKALSEFSYIDRIFITDKAGVLKAIYPSSPENIGKSFAFRDWYKGVSEKWQPYASEVFKRAPYPQFNTVAVSVPIKDMDGSILGVLGLAMNLDSFYELIKDYSIEQKEFLYIVNQKGQIVAHPKYSALGEIVDYKSEPVVKKITNGQNGVEITYSPIEKEERLSAYEIVPKYKWGVVFAEPTSTAFISRERTLGTVLLVNGLFILINTLLAIAILLSKARLTRANLRLKQLDKMKDEFVSLASHELRTPMTSIAGFVDMMREGRYGTVTKELLEPLGYVAESTDRLIRLVNDLLNVSRIEAGRMKFTLTQVDLGKVATKVVTGLGPIAEKKHLTLVSEVKEAINVQADSEKVEEILHNLIGNSLKFTDTGGITVTVERDSDFGVIEVVDTGIGISAEERIKLFGKFEQVESDGAARPSGTGLGLYLSRQMAQKMGGDVILAESKRNAGSKFALKLPIVDSTSAKQASKQLASERDATPDQK
ncbi:MAG: sensor histidine kinase [Candidatus Levybacteria bacterium]|nr:sensor histidine kinase [Candidatus Levybacteria bacterium]